MIQLGRGGVVNEMERWCNLPVFSNSVLVVFGRFMMTMSSLSTNGMNGRVPSPAIELKSPRENGEIHTSLVK